MQIRSFQTSDESSVVSLWKRCDLPKRAGRTIVDLRGLLSLNDPTAGNAAVRFLFGLRAWLGRVLGWDRVPPEATRESFIQRLSASDRQRSLVEPGTPEGQFRVLFVSPREAISEIHNSTVHAFSVLALVEHASGYTLYWGIYVRPGGRVTSFYMRLIDPFRRLIIYPSVLRYIRSAWGRETSEAAA